MMKMHKHFVAGMIVLMAVSYGQAANNTDNTGVKANEEAGKTDPYPLLVVETRDIMWESATRIGMDLGYDSTVQLYCFFNSNLVNQSAENRNDKKATAAEFEKYLNTVDPSTVWTIYTQVNANIAGAQYLQRYYKSKKVWKYVNYMNKTLIPGCLSYFKPLEDYVKKNPTLAEKLRNNSNEIVECRKRAILSQKNRIGIVDEYQ